MIAVGTATGGPGVAELFELFKTPWRRLDSDDSSRVAIVDESHLGRLGDSAVLVIVNGAGDDRLPPHPDGWPAAVDGLDLPIYGERAPSLWEETVTGGRRTIRLGYDLFAEISHLLAVGQPPSRAAVPTAEHHIELLRRALLASGIPVIEVPPRPSGTEAIACLTHDVDFVRLRNHAFDRTLAGFLYRATLGTLTDVLAGRVGWSKVARNLLAVLQLPLVLTGLARDPWMLFDKYTELEMDWHSTFFLVPFRGRPGDRVDLPHPERRAVGYDLEEVETELRRLVKDGFEVALHGLDAWIDAESAKTEVARIEEASGSRCRGARMHWLLYDRSSPQALEDAGLDYDATRGYNDTVGFHAGTAQVFRPPGSSHLLELPLIVQDSALMYRSHLRLSETEAIERALGPWRDVLRYGGSMTLLWHMRSLAPERLWGAIYRRILGELSTVSIWSGTAAEVVDWFRGRRRIFFEAITLSEGHLRARIGGTPEAADRLDLRILIPIDGRVDEYLLPLTGPEVAGMLHGTES